MSTSPRLLIATDNSDDATLIRGLLAEEFKNVGISTDPEQALQDFEQQPPAVLLLAFDTLDQSQSHYLGLYRRSSRIHALPHRTVILCDKHEVQQAYALCRRQQFNDYVLFWPVSHDAPRLLMAVHHALHQHAAAVKGQPSAGEIAVQARRLDGLGGLLEGQAAKGQEVADGMQRSLAHTGASMGHALDRVADWFVGPEGAALLASGDRFALDRAFVRLKAEAIERHLQAVAASLQPVQQWAGELQDELPPQVAALRSLEAVAALVPRVALIVDDDPFQRKLLERMLTAAGFEAVSAESSLSAIAMAGRRRPDIVLMDVDLPDVDGVETTRRLKSSQGFASTQVLMITGHSDRDMVLRSVQAGAAGFLVKPFDKDTLLAKVASCLDAALAPAVRPLPTSCKR